MVSLDVGTSRIKAALGEINHLNEIHVMGVTQVPSLGLRKGNIVDIESTAKSIDACLNDLERLTGIEIASTVAGFSGVSLSALRNHAVIAVGNANEEISWDDKERVLHSAQNIALPGDKTVVQIIERQYIVDGYEGVTDPVGMIGNRLEAEVLIVIAATAALQNLQRSAQRINLTFDQLMYNQLLVAEAVLMPAEKEMGVALIDMGGGTTEISLFKEGAILSTSVLPIGGEYITKDLAIVLRTSLEEAARIKESHGVAAPEMADPDFFINVRNIQGNEIRQVSQQLVAEIISARVMEMLAMINAELQQMGHSDHMAGGIVFTGGGAELNGFIQVMEEYIELPARIGKPDNLKGLNEDLNRPHNAVALGGLIFGLRNVQPVIIEERHGVSSVINRFNYWFKELFA